MKAAISIVIILLSGGACVIAQENLIRNWSFEEREPNFLGDSICPSNGGSIGISKYWNSAWGSVDYFNACSNEEWPLWGVPDNWFGNQQAYDGVAYSALVGYSDFLSNAREYLWQELDQPLKAGFGYMFTMQVSLNDSDEWAFNGLGALFTQTDTRLWGDGELFFSSHPQVIHIWEPLTNKSEWTMISGYFIATGGEKFISIGNFLADDDPILSIQRVDTFADIPVNWEISAYYIDAITLHEVSGVGLEEQSSNYNEQLTVWPNPATHTIRIAARQPLQRLRLVDMLGQEVLNLEPETLNHELNIAHLPPGLYTIEAHTHDGRVARQRVVKVDGP